MRWTSWVLDVLILLGVVGLVVATWLMAWRGRVELRIARKREALLDEWAGATNDVADLAFEASLRRLANR